MHTTTVRPVRRIVSLLLIPLIAFGLSGCFSAQITTDKQPSGQTIEKPWATGLLFGLVMPGAQIDAAQQCPNGVAEVETKQSFLNGLAAGFTMNLYTPMSVTVTCAASGSMSDLQLEPDFTVPEEADDATAHDVFQAAARQSAQAAAPVRVKLD